ncbi:C40 family peptidase [Liquorilactobacillus vini]|uniref:C40 family peptidase n=3 Tax=Liquorilactobacillus vini TaxID=238015 RepID=UPI00029B131E
MKQSAKTIIAGTVGAAGLFLASTANANAATTVKVAKNDTVWGLAQKYNVSIKSIETLNNINQNTHLIVTNQSVKIPDSSNSAKTTDSKTTSSVTVKSGDTLWDLAKQYNTSVENLLSLNSLSSDLIKPGQVLKVNGTAATTDQDTDTQQTTTTTTPSVTVSANHVTYTVKSGDSLYSIAQAYGVSVDSLRSSNSLGSVLTVGQTLTINDPTKTPTTTTTTSTSSTTTANAASSSTTATQAAASSSSATSSSATTTQASSTTAASSSAATQASSTTATSSSAATTQASSTTAASSSTSQTSSNSSTSTTTSSTSVSASSVISYAEQFIGVPYVYGGTTPNGFDCSGFVQYVYAHFGVSLPRTSEAQSTIGSAVSVSSAEPGDLIFWGGVGSAYHVGIYLGGTSYIAAPKTGESVSVKSFQYWQPSFAIHMN